MLKGNTRRPLATVGRAGQERGYSDLSEVNGDWQRLPAMGKRGRRRIASKLAILNGRPALATFWRKPEGCQSAVSMPLAMIGDAGRQGAGMLILRDDRLGQEWGTAIDDLKSRGWFADSHRLPEVFVKVAALQSSRRREGDLARDIAVGDYREPEFETPEAEEGGIRCRSPSSWAFTANLKMPARYS